MKDSLTETAKACEWDEYLAIVEVGGALKKCDSQNQLI